jgi:pimeloyl-ACP methyl ester carboxylesterase
LPLLSLGRHSGSRCSHLRCFLNSGRPGFSICCARQFSARSSRLQWSSPSGTAEFNPSLRGLIPHCQKFWKVFANLFGGSQARGGWSGCCVGGNRQKCWGKLLPRSARFLILHGQRDGAIPITFAQRASEMIPDARLLIFDSGHFLPLNIPEVLSDQLRSFFGSDLEAAPVLSGMPLQTQNNEK